MPTGLVCSKYSGPRQITLYIVLIAKCDISKYVNHVLQLTHSVYVDIHSFVIPIFLYNSV